MMSLRLMQDPPSILTADKLHQLLNAIPESPFAIAYKLGQKRAKELYDQIEFEDYLRLLAALKKRRQEDDEFFLSQQIKPNYSFTTNNKNKPTTLLDPMASLDVEWLRKILEEIAKHLLHLRHTELKILELQQAQTRLLSAWQDQQIQDAELLIARLCQPMTIQGHSFSLDSNSEITEEIRQALVRPLPAQTLERLEAGDPTHPVVEIHHQLIKEHEEQHTANGLSALEAKIAAKKDAMLILNQYDRTIMLNDINSVVRYSNYLLDQYQDIFQLLNLRTVGLSSHIRTHLHNRSEQQAFKADMQTINENYISNQENLVSKQMERLDDICVIQNLIGHLRQSSNYQKVMKYCHTETYLQQAESLLAQQAEQVPALDSLYRRPAAS